MKNNEKVRIRQVSSTKTKSSDTQLASFGLYSNSSIHLIVCDVDVHGNRHNVGVNGREDRRG